MVAYNCGGRVLMVAQCGQRNVAVSDEEGLPCVETDYHKSLKYSDTQKSGCNHPQT